MMTADGKPEYRTLRQLTEYKNK